MFGLFLEASSASCSCGVMNWLPNLSGLGCHYLQTWHLFLILRGQLPELYPLLQNLGSQNKEGQGMAGN